MKTRAHTYLFLFALVALTPKLTLAQYSPGVGYYAAARSPDSFSLLCTILILLAIVLQFFVTYQVFTSEKTNGLNAFLQAIAISACLFFMTLGLSFMGGVQVNWALMLWPFAVLALCASISFHRLRTEAGIYATVCFITVLAILVIAIAVRLPMY